jgi:pimeloyl-ACP methyl ester carboxylesterase
MTHAPIIRHALSRRAVLAAVAFAVPGLALARSQAGSFRFAGPRGMETDAERGFFEVPEDRRDPRSRKITLGYVRFPSTAARPGPPIVYLAGGPGGAGTGAAAGPRFPIFMALRELADVVAFDQRGTGLSNQIPRRSPSAGSLPPLTRAGLTAAFRDEVRAAWADWAAAGVAMAGYNTEQSADDVDGLRRHLGAERIDLWGISYGTHLALSVLKRHGDRVRRVALASLEGQDQTVKRPARIDAYFRRVDALLGADPAVREAVPDLPALMRRVHARLEAEPVRVTSTIGGAPAELAVGGFAVQMLAGGMVANPQTTAMLPALYLALDAGERSVLSAFIGQVAGQLRVTGMPEAMDLASGVSPERLALVEREARTAVLGDAMNFPMPHLLGAVPGVDLGAAFRAPVRIEHPALLVAGTLDGRTPLEEQAEVAAQFRRKTQVTVENAGHNVFEAHPDVQDLLVRFFGDEATADTRLSLPPPTFALG